MIGSTISQYRIVSELGRGGMGVVYEAHDKKLDRRVALKFIAAHLTSDATAKERFVREARAAAMLQHDAICAIYDVSEAPDGSTYIVMPLYQGAILKELIKRGPIASERALSFTRQIASGLRAAHAKGLVHRDIKPGNILVTNEDRIKILDFGLAKLVGEADLTVSHSTVGTMAYMSPEQVQGQKVDERSDLWSLGVILYEMLTGGRPFSGEYDAALVYGIVNQAVDLSDARIPETVRPLLARLLDKSVDTRMRSADELVKAIDDVLGGSGASTISKAVATAPAGASEAAEATPEPVSSFFGTLKGRAILSAAAVVILLGLWAAMRGRSDTAHGDSPATTTTGQFPSVAVMYIENNTPRDRLGYVIRDMLARNLARADSIRVVSNQRLKDILVQETGAESESVSPATASRVAKQASIQSMILGSIVQLGTEYVLEVELSDVESGNIIDAVSVTAATEGDIMEAVNEVTARILSGTGSMLAVENGALRIQDVSTSSMSAYELYELGLDHEDHWRFADAADAFRRAIALDSTFVLPYVEAALASSIFGFSPTANLNEPREFLAAANRHLDSASDKERRLVDVLTRIFSGRRDTLISTDRRALADDYPDDKRLQFFAAGFGAGDEWKTYVDRTLELDPSFAPAYNMLAYTKLWEGDVDEAFSNARKYIALQPDVQNTVDSAWEVMTAAGHEDDAIGVLDKSIRDHPDWANNLWRKAYTLAVAGDTTEAWGLLDAFAGTTNSPDYMRAYRQSHLALAFGQWERARILSATSLREARRFKSDDGLLADLRNHAAVLHAVGRHEDARRILDEAVEISRQVSGNGYNPMPAIAAYQNGLGYADAGDVARLTEVIDEMDEILKLPGMDGRHRRLQALLKTHLDILKGDYTHARQVFGRPSGFGDQRSHGVRLAAWLEGMEGNTTEALRDFQMLEHGVALRGYGLSAYPSFFIDHAVARYETARMFDARGDTAEALRRYRDALAEWEKTGATFNYVELARARVRELE